MADTGYGSTVADALGVLLVRGTRHALVQRLVEGVGPGVTDTTYPVLTTLARTGPLSISELAREIGLDRSVVSRHADVLEAAGLLSRRAGTDARVAVLTLTATGRRVVSTMHRRLVRMVERELTTWPTRRAAAFTQGLERIAAVLGDLDDQG